jgi:uncharacterized membrane protein
VTRKVERLWPYILSTTLTITWRIAGFDLSNSKGYEGALETSASMCSILLGFIAAIFPIILSLQSSDGSYVKQVIKQGGDLLKSYNVEVLISGFLLIIVVMFNYFRFDVRCSLKTFLFYFWLFCVILFIGCCARCMYFLFRLILVKEDKKMIPLESDAEKRLKKE